MKLQDAIVYMKMDELLAKVDGGAVTDAAKSTHGRGEQMYSRQALMRPETYRNGAESRAFLQMEIGEHFWFTTLGMDWIKQR